MPTSWNDYQKKVLHKSEDFSLEYIKRHLRIEEETRIRDKKTFQFGIYKKTFGIYRNEENSPGYIVDCSSSWWHYRLAHLNFRSLNYMSKYESLNYMSKYELISNDDKIENKCDFCILIRKHFPKSERNE